MSNLFNIVLEVLAMAKMQEREVNNIRLKRKYKIGFFFTDDIIIYRKCDESS